ncbi:MAG: LytTR family DNA-binding domain-containing protein [Bacteroidota bacterium]
MNTPGMTCMILDDEAISRHVIRHMVAQTDFLEMAYEFSNPLEALSSLDKVDLLFLDVEMPEMTGLELMDITDNLPQIIMITSKSDYAVSAFEHSVTDYLVKPVTYPRFLKAVMKARENHDTHRLNHTRTGSDIFVRSESRIVKIDLTKVLFVEALADYVLLHTAEEKYIVHSTMKALERKLPTDFVRVHRSYIVNQTKITAIEDLNILIGKKYIPIGASYKEAFLKRLNFL